MSATGYIEDPFIATQIRIRADAGWDDVTPDRAEFFYAKCGCFRLLGLDPNAPGPGPGIVTNLRFQEYSAAVEYAVKRRFSVFVEAPSGAFSRFLSSRREETEECSRIKPGLAISGPDSNGPSIPIPTAI
jgi:hypothetical protein